LQRINHDDFKSPIKNEISLAHTISIDEKKQLGTIIYLATKEIKLRTKTYKLIKS
jgi:hypothetical protein